MAQLGGDHQGSPSCPQRRQYAGSKSWQSLGFAVPWSGKGSRMEDEFSTLRAKLMAVIGTSLDAAQLADLVGDVLKAGGGVRMELDDARFTVIRREGRFVVKKDDHRPSTMPPRR